MMRKTIVRTLCTSSIKACLTVIKDGNPTLVDLEPLVVMGKATEKEALKALKEVHGKEASIAIVSIDVEENVYEISVDDFVKYATKKGSESSEKSSEGSETPENKNEEKEGSK